MPSDAKSTYLHYRPELVDESGEFTISFFRQAATEVLGHDVLAVSALSAAEQEELLEDQVGRQLKVEVKASWYSPGSKYSFTGDTTTTRVSHHHDSCLTTTTTHALPSCPLLLLFCAAQQKPCATLTNQPRTSAAQTRQPPATLRMTACHETPDFSNTKKQQPRGPWRHRQQQMPCCVLRL